MSALVTDKLLKVAANPKQRANDMQLTDVQVRKAVASGVPRVLTDGRGKGVGRLVLIIRSSAEWYARIQRDGKRQSVKLGTYPEMSLSVARERFEFMRDGLGQGKPIRAAVSLPDGSVDDLFAGYLATLSGRASHNDTKRCLETFASWLGKERAASSITTSDITKHLRPVYKRDKVRMADKYRAMVRAAFSWGMASESDYRAEVEARFRLSANPADAIPAEATAVGSRLLSVDELRDLWAFLGDRTTHRAVKHIAFSGLRPSEICRIHSGMISDGIVTWGNTKNGKPFSLPWWGGEFSGLLLPAEYTPEKSLRVHTGHTVVYRYGKGFNLRDLRRTWKTLAGEAGISKELRDIWQNHARSDVSSVHYDRYEYLPEKRQVLELWTAWFRDKIGTPP